MRRDQHRSPQKCKTPDEIAAATSPWGISRHEASRRLINEVETVLRHAELAEARLVEAPETSKLRLWPKITKKLPGWIQYYAGTEDGFLGLICCIVAAVTVCIPEFRVGDHQLLLNFRKPAMYFLLCLPYYIGNGWIYYVLRRVERIRATSQLKEALAQYKGSIHREYVAKSKHHRPPVTDSTVAEVAIPSSSLASVLRDGEWTRLPFNLVVAGDTIKLRRGDIAPCQAIRVVLSSTFHGQQSADSIPDSYELVFDNATIAKGDVMEEDMGIYVSTETPAVGQVQRFLESAAQARLRRSAAFSDSLAAPFIANAENVYTLALRPCMWLLLLIVVLILLIRCLVFPRLMFGLYPANVLRDQFLIPFVVLILYNPMLVRFIGQIGDIWANARLQSLFLYHQERRFLEEQCQQCDICETSNEANGEDLSMSETSETQSVSSLSIISGPSSVHSDVSVSRVPFRKQFEEVVSVYRQGLDGSTNLLHALASTTYLCFIDHEALVIDQCGQLKEMCVMDSKRLGSELHVESSSEVLNSAVEKISQENSFDEGAPATRLHASISSRCPKTPTSEKWKLHTLQVTSTAFDEGFYDNDKLKYRSQQDDLTKSPPPLDVPPAYRRRKVSSVRRKRKFTPNMVPGSDAFADDSPLSVLVPDQSKALSESVPHQSNAMTVRREVDRELADSNNPSTSRCPKENETPDEPYLRFVDENLGSRLVPNILPLALALQMTQTPAIPKMLGSSVGWLHTQRIHDVFQREEWAWNCCLCSAAELLSTRLVWFEPIRHVLLLSRGSEPSAHPLAIDNLHSALNIDNDKVPSLLDRNDDTFVDGAIDTTLPHLNDYELTLPDVPNYQRSDMERKPLLYSVLARDSRTDDTHLFVKGSAEVLIAECRYIFDGNSVLELTTEMVQKLENILMQWKSEGYIIYCLGYGQVPVAARDYLLASLEEYTLLSTEYGESSIPKEGNLGVSSKHFKGHWEPLIAYPGPRSVFRRPEPFVFPSALKSSQKPLAVDGWPTLNFLNYNNTIMHTPYPAFGEGPLRPTGSHYSLDDTKSFIEEQHLELYHKVSWLPHKCQVRGAKILKSLMDKNLILTGLVALKQTTPPGVPKRIVDFHSAGVRFSLFSPYDLRTTRTLGEVLGLETGWNCLISLEDHDREEGFVNQDGNEVLPSGMDRIRRHVKRIDNVPLLVSLYANSTPKTVLQFVQLLQSQNEVVTVIGSSLKTSNFDVFKIASCPISILPLPYSLCPKCHGRKSVGPSYSPQLLPEYSFSAALTSLPCALQSHAVSFGDRCNHNSALAQQTTNPGPPSDSPEFLLQLLYSIFQEARRLMSGVQSAMTFATMINVIFLGGLLVSRLVLNCPLLFSVADVYIMATIYVPLLSIAMFSNPARPSLMTTLPSNILPENRPRNFTRDDSLESCEQVSPKIRLNFCATPHRNNSKAVLRAGVVLQCCKLVCPVLFTIVLSHWWLVRILQRIALQFELENNPRDLYLGKWSDLFIKIDNRLNDKSFSTLLLSISGQLSLGMTLWHIFILAICHTSRYDSPWTFNPFKNKTLPMVFAFILLIAGTRAGVVLNSLVARHEWLLHLDWFDSVIWVVCGVTAPLCTFTVCEVIKAIDKKQHQRRQKFMRLFFHTRLGMWSPK